MAWFRKARRSVSPSRALLAQSGLRARKRLGQHFLEDPRIIDRIMALAGLNENDVVVEIGPGLGALTLPMLPHIRHVVVVEKDPALLGILKQRVQPEQGEKISFIAGDVLRLDVRQIHDQYGGKVKIVGNLPYNISSPVLGKLIRDRDYIGRAILMFQLEVAQRLTAGPRTGEYSALSVMVQYYGRVSPLIRVSRDAFYPKPKVDSMVVEIDFERPHPVRAEDEESFQAVIRAAFSCRRKTILNSLQRGMASIPREVIAQALERCLIDPKRRAETLTVDEYVHLSACLKAGRHSLDTA
jgi:16S rRNA (adenine1518-N6/adenine1519-N6)-dimethyltransferase